MTLIVAMAEMANHAENHPWPSLEWASWVFDRASFVLAVSLIFGAVATVAIVWMGIVKEHHWDLAREHAAEKTAALGLETSKANAEVAKAHEGLAKANAEIASANARSKEAELKLEQLRERMGPRHIKGEQFLKVLEGKPKAPVEILFPWDDGEAFQLALEIRDWLKRASWEVEAPRAITAADLSPRLAANNPAALAAGGQPQGVSVFLRIESPADLEREREKNPLNPDEPLDTPRKALSRALLYSLGTVAGGMSEENGRLGVLRVIVGQKPNPN